VEDRTGVEVGVERAALVVHREEEVPEGEVVRRVMLEEESKGSVKEEGTTRSVDATRLSTAERTKESLVKTALPLWYDAPSRFWKRWEEGALGIV
jgi:hypothetical protein